MLSLFTRSWSSSLVIRNLGRGGQLGVGSATDNVSVAFGLLYGRGELKVSEVDCGSMSDNKHCSADNDIIV